MISTDRHWIFVHIQKTGGNAVRDALGAEINGKHKHFLARDLRELHGEAEWNKCFKFAFVRNPWDRLVSWWSMIDGEREQFDAANAQNKFPVYILERAQTFEEFLARCTEEITDADGPKYIFRNQIDYLIDADGTVIVDFIGRFENLQQDFDKVTNRLGLPRIELPRINTSRHGHYADYYKPAMAETVSRLYARDIETFGYRFGE